MTLEQIFYAVLAVILVVIAIVSHQVTGIMGLTAGIMVGGGISLLKSTSPGMFED